MSEVDSFSVASPAWTDYLFEGFMTFRLGNKPSKKKTYDYFQLKYRASDANHHHHRRIELIPSSDYFTDQVRQALAYQPLEFPFSSLPVKSSSTQLRIIMISDTHDRHKSLKQLPECDLLIHAGDILMTSRKLTPAYAYQKYEAFLEWFTLQPAKQKIVIGGNHDRLLEHLSPEERQSLFREVHYLCNEAITVEGVTVFGTPYSQGASGNQAFQSQEFYQATKAAIQHYQQEVRDHRAPPIDVLITHGPCSEFRDLVKPQLFHVSGHSHYYHGVYLFQRKSPLENNRLSNLINVCAPIMDERYNPTGLPVILDCKITEESSAVLSEEK